MVDMSYPYNAIFGRGLLNTIEVALHSLYLCMKVPATLGVISVHGNLKDKRNIEPECETKRVPLDLMVPDKTVIISQELTSNEETELLSFLDKNSDVFVWKTFDLMGVRRDILEQSYRSTHTQDPGSKGFTKC
jgi:hypothetical protein